MRTLLKAAHVAMVASTIVLGLLLAVSLSLGIYAHLVDDEVEIFYSDTIDATCISTMHHGKPVMDCLDGKRTQEAP